MHRDRCQDEQVIALGTFFHTQGSQGAHQMMPISCQVCARWSCGAFFVEMEGGSKYGILNLVVCGSRGRCVVRSSRSRDGLKERTRTTTVALVVNNESAKKPPPALMDRHRSSTVSDPHCFPNSRLADRNWAQKAATRSRSRTPIAPDRDLRTK
jgi:hypothetical protein